MGASSKGPDLPAPHSHLLHIHSKLRLAGRFSLSVVYRKSTPTIRSTLYVSTRISSAGSTHRHDSPITVMKPQRKSQKKKKKKKSRQASSFASQCVGWSRKKVGEVEKANRKMKGGSSYISHRTGEASNRKSNRRLGSSPAMNISSGMEWGCVRQLALSAATIVTGLPTAELRRCRSISDLW